MAHSAFANPHMIVVAIQYNARALGHYALHAFAVMPNRVHLLVAPAVPLPKLTKSLKGIAARQANAMLALTGRPFWQEQSYDHLVRHEREFDKIRNYIERNPVRAGLVKEPGEYRWSSAGWATWRPPAIRPQWLKAAANSPTNGRSVIYGRAPLGCNRSAGSREGTGARRAMLLKRARTWLAADERELTPIEKRQLFGAHPRSAAARNRLFRLFGYPLALGQSVSRLLRERAWAPRTYRRIAVHPRTGACPGWCYTEPGLRTVLPAVPFGAGTKGDKFHRGGVQCQRTWIL